MTIKIKDTSGNTTNYLCSKISYPDSGESALVLTFSGGGGVSIPFANIDNFTIE